MQMVRTVKGEKETTLLWEGKLKDLNSLPLKAFMNLPNIYYISTEDKRGKNVNIKGSGPVQVLFSTGWLLFFNLGSNNSRA